MEKSIRKARMDDYDNVMKIPEGEIMYGGYDYLPNEYQTLVQWHGAYVLEIGNKVVGYLAYEIIDEASCYIPLAGRISPSMQGQGLFRYLMEEVAKRIKDDYPTVKTCRMSTTFSNSFKERIMKSRNHVHSVLYYHIPLNHINFEPVKDGGKFKVLSEVELQELCDNQISVKNISGSGYMLVNWRYYRFDCMEAKNRWMPFQSFHCIASYQKGENDDEVTALTLTTISLRGSPSSTKYLRLLGLDVHSTLLTKDLLIQHVDFTVNYFREIGKEYDEIRITVPEIYKELVENVFAVEGGGKTLCFESDA